MSRMGTALASGRDEGEPQFCVSMQTVKRAACKAVTQTHCRFESYLAYSLTATVHEILRNEMKLPRRNGHCAASDLPL